MIIVVVLCCGGVSSQTFRKMNVFSKFSNRATERNNRLDGRRICRSRRNGNIFANRAIEEARRDVDAEGLGDPRRSLRVGVAETTADDRHEEDALAFGFGEEGSKHGGFDSSAKEHLRNETTDNVVFSIAPGLVAVEIESANKKESEEGRSVIAREIGGILRVKSSSFGADLKSEGKRR